MSSVGWIFIGSRSGRFAETGARLAPFGFAPTRNAKTHSKFPAGKPCTEKIVPRAATLYPAATSRKRATSSGFVAKDVTSRTPDVPSPASISGHS